MPQLLSENPDSFAVKLRYLKIGMLGLKRGDPFDPNEYKKLFITSPSTIKAKKQYCIDHGIAKKKILSLIELEWSRFLKFFNPTLEKEDIAEVKKKITKPYKTRYDT